MQGAVPWAINNPGNRFANHWITWTDPDEAEADAIFRLDRLTPAPMCYDSVRHYALSRRNVRKLTLAANCVWFDKECDLDAIEWRRAWKTSPLQCHAFRSGAPYSRPFQ